MAAIKVCDPIRMLVEVETDDLSWLALMPRRLHSVAILEPEGEPNNAGIAELKNAQGFNLARLCRL